MFRKTVLASISVLVAFFSFLQSCYKLPTACFTTNIGIDSIRVDTPVIFNALSCSTNASAYNWQFGNGDSLEVEFGPIVTKTFTDTGNIDVYLLVTKGQKQNSFDKIIHVNP